MSKKNKKIIDFGISTLGGNCWTLFNVLDAKNYVQRSKMGQNIKPAKFSFGPTNPLGRNCYYLVI